MNAPHKPDDTEEAAREKFGGVHDEPEEPVIGQDIEAYYDMDRKEFLVENSEGIWIPHTESQFKRHLRFAGHTAKTDNGLTSPAERVLVGLMDSKTVRYAAPLAGRKAGYYKEGGVAFLVTESHKLPEPQEGEFHMLSAIVRGLLGQGLHGDHQVELFFGWLRAGVRALRDGATRPGQALALAGPADCGKSLLQKIITEVLGGRSAKAAMFLVGRTDFNAELFEAEHLMLEDESMSPDIRSRRQLGDQIKAFVVNEVHACHRKGRTAVNLRPWWRISISVNDDPEAMLVLPPLDDNIADKIMLLKAESFEMPMPGDTIEERRAFWLALMAEIPALIDFLLTTETPKELQDRRYGVTSWHHPELVDDLHHLSGERHLLELIDRAVFESPSLQEWEGTADKLKLELMEDPTTRDEGRQLLNWRNATGTFLGKLAKVKPGRVVAIRTANSRSWKICRPANGKD